MSPRGTAGAGPGTRLVVVGGSDAGATAIFHAMAVEELADLDLAYSPPLGSPWDAVQIAAHAWSAEHRHRPAPGAHQPRTRAVAAHAAAGRPRSTP